MTLQLNFTLPALPEIKSDAIREQVFTHRSVFARRIHVFEDPSDDPSLDNEKFEYLGDTVLGLVVSDLLLDEFPTLRVGPSTKIRSLIVGNDTLAALSNKYGLCPRLRLHPTLHLASSPSVQADLFESFVGGLYRDQGYETVKSWLSELVRPIAREAYEIIRAQHELGSPPEVKGPLQTDIDHLSRFNFYVQKTSRKVEWQYFGASDIHTNDNLLAEFGLQNTAVVQAAKVTPLWLVKLLLDGEFYGRGKGNTKKAARSQAALMGLERLGVTV